MNAFSKEKPIVHYSPIAGAIIAEGYGALVIAHDHPDTVNTTPGHDVLTSTVVSYDPETGAFETLSTQYVLKGE